MIAYAISEPSILHKDLDAYLSYLSNRCDILLYRDKDNPNYFENAKDILEKSQLYGIKKLFIHKYIDVADSLNVDGIHLTSSQFDDISYSKRKGLFTTISTHSIDEIGKAQRLGADMVTLSPIFPSPNKGEPLGIEYLREAIRVSKIPIIALGGIISEREISQLKSIGVKGFASIRYFFPK